MDRNIKRDRELGSTSGLGFDRPSHHLYVLQAELQNSVIGSRSKGLLHELTGAILLASLPQGIPDAADDREGAAHPRRSFPTQQADDPALRQAMRTGPLLGGDHVEGIIRWLLIIIGIVFVYGIAHLALARGTELFERHVGAIVAMIVGAIGLLLLWLGLKGGGRGFNGLLGAIGVLVLLLAAGMWRNRNAP